MRRSPSSVWTQAASSTRTWAIVTASGPPFTTFTTISPGRGSVMRSMVSSSTGGNARWKTPAGPTRRNATTAAASRTSGAMPFTHVGSVAARRSPRPATTRTGASDIEVLPDIEDPHPARFRELALVRVEHERPRMPVRDLEPRALALTEHHRVRPLVTLQVRSRPVEAEEVPVEVERVDEVELRDVDQVDAVQLAQPDRDGVPLIMEGDGVDRVHLVLVVEVRVERVHHHHHLACRRPALPGVDQEHPVETLVDVPLERGRVAVVEVQPERLGIELVHVVLPRLHDLEHAVHVRRVDAVEVDRVRMGAGVGEADPHAVALGATDRGPRHLAVERPCREVDSGCDLDLAVHGHQVVLPEHLP